MVSAVCMCRIRPKSFVSQIDRRAMWWTARLIPAKFASDRKSKPDRKHGNKVGNPRSKTLSMSVTDSQPPSHVFNS
jgi:hypothetical protein